MILRTILLGGLLAGLAACADRPVAELRPLTTQLVLETAAHWRTLADEIATDVAVAMARDAAPGGAEDRTVRVVAPDPRSRFGRAIAAMVAVALHERGVAVSDAPGRAAVLTIGWQVLPRLDRAVATVPGSVSAAAAFSGLGFGAATADGVAPTVGALTGVALFADTLAAVAATPGSEVVVEARLRHGGATLMALQRLFYVRASDLAEYAHAEGYALTRPIAAPVGGVPALRSFAAASE